MFIKINEENIECATTLRVAMNIQRKFKKPYMKVLQDVENLGIEEQISILFCGIELVNQNMKETEFRDYILDNVGLDELSELIEEFINGIQYPGLTEEEIEKKLAKKMEKYNKMKSYGLKI